MTDIYIMALKSIIRKGLDFILYRLSPKTIVYPQISLLAPNELLKGRVALVTGGTSGIGFEIARAFINAGAIVVITGRSQERLEKATGLLRAGNNSVICAYGVVMDITKPSRFKEKIS